MAGHSKWNNIKRKKGKTDAQRAKIFTKIGREIQVAVREGGGDPSVNGKLRDLVAKAKANNVPNENIDRIIKKAVGGDDKNDYIEMTYEGYGPNGIAIIARALTDNKNRTAGDVRHYFDKYGGNLGTTGCVSFMFSQMGNIIIDKDGIPEDKIMEDAILAGASDILSEGDVYEIHTPTSSLRETREALENCGYTFLSSEIEQIPSTYTAITDDEAASKMLKLLELLEDNDDIQEVWHNWENEAEYNL